MADAFRTLIVPAAQVVTARTIADSWGPAGEGMWTTGLSATGRKPATHYVSTGYIGADVAHLVPCQTWEQDEEGNWTQTGSEPGNPDALMAWLAEQEVDVPRAEVDALYASADVTAQLPFTAFARLGVQIVQEDPEPIATDPETP